MSALGLAVVCWCGGVALGVLRQMGRTVVGRWMLGWVGHMAPPSGVAGSVGDLTYRSPLGLEASLDPCGRALRAWERFGVGFIEVGPWLPSASAPAGQTIERWLAPAQGWSMSSAEAVACLPVADIQALRVAGVHVFLRVAVGASVQEVPMFPPVGRGAGRLGFTLTGDVSAEVISAWRQRLPGALVLASIDAQLPTDRCRAEILRAVAAEVDGIWLSEGNGRTVRLWTPDLEDEVLALIRQAREMMGPDRLLVISGLREPAQAGQWLAAGATWVAAGGGIVFTGPGLLHRSHRCLLWEGQDLDAAPLDDLSFSVARHAWVWACCLGVAMAMGGVLALGLASSRVLLPYDEVYCGMKRDVFVQISPQLLPFMSHDRATLAGTMLSLGVLYAALGWQAIRAGHHWAQVAVAVSALSGFLTFFAFLGFGYFDPFHAFVAAILFQCLLLLVHSPLGRKPAVVRPDPTDDAAWRGGQWGQLILVALSLGLIGAGVVITAVGCGQVFVKEDTDYLGISVEGLRAANDRLVPLIAHDRASLGGMLIAHGWVLLLWAFWGLERGARWQWWALATSGCLAFSIAIGVHYAVGYTNWEHLAPAFLGAALWALCLSLLRPWLVTQRESGPGAL